MFCTLAAANFSLAPFDLVGDGIQSALDQFRLEVGDDPADVGEVFKDAERRAALEIHEEEVAGRGGNSGRPRPSPAIS